jgi:hypothetical protein
MGWVLRLVDTETDGPAEGDVMEIRAPRDLGDIAHLGLTLSEAKQLLARVQQAVVAAQADDHAVLRPDCSFQWRSVSDQGLAAASGRDVVRRGVGAASAVSLR